MFRPKPFTAGSLDELSRHVVDELDRVAQAGNDPLDAMQLNVLYVAPKKPRAGMVVLADGTRWNPGSGAGFYGYTGTAWAFLGPLRSGTAVLAAGTVVVALTTVTANSRILLTSQVDGGTPGFLRVTARVAGVSFTITSSSNLDTSTAAYLVVEP